MSLSASESLATERATFPVSDSFASGPFAPVTEATKGGNEVVRALLTSLLALYPVLAAVAVALVSANFLGQA